MDDATIFVIARGGVRIFHDELVTTPLELVAVTTNAHGDVAVTEVNVTG